MVTTETVVETLANLDLQLVRQAKAGDKESFTQLYEQMAAELYKVALFTVGSSFGQRYLSGGVQGHPQPAG